MKMVNDKRLIDANEAFEIVTDLAGQADTKGAYKAFWTAARAIQKMPTVDAVEVVHGRWVMKETMIRSPFAKNAYCSVCLEETSYAHNYCPNCGAKMDGDVSG